jgi:hypothetical protein
MIRHALFWVVAMILPVTVMIVLDLFDLHTPSRVGLWGSLSLIVPYHFANQYLGRELGRFVTDAKA